MIHKSGTVQTLVSSRSAAISGVWLRAAIVGVIVFGALVRLWAALQWKLNFDSDEAVFGLMARRMLQGELPATVYGTRHLGSIESGIAALSMAVFGPSVIAFRSSAIVLFSLFLLVHTAYTRRAYGSAIALLSLLFLAVPGFHILAWTYQPIGAYMALLLLGTSALLLGRLRPFDNRGTIIKSLGLGLISGLGLWSNQMILVYLLASIGVIVLGSPEWARLLRHSDALSASMLRPGTSLMPLVTVVFAALIALAFFIGGCEPAWRFSHIAAVARAILVVSILIIMLGLFMASSRKRLLGWQSLLFALGFASGYFPQWGEWLLSSVPPRSVIRLSCPDRALSRALFTFRELMPAAWGLPDHAELLRPDPATMLQWVLLGVLGILAVGCCTWLIRRRLKALMVMQHLKPRAQRDGALAILFWLPILLGIFGSNTVDIHSVRHLLVTWHASTVLFAIFLSRVLGKRRGLAMFLAGIWLITLAMVNLLPANSRWQIKFTPYTSSSVSQLSQYLQMNSATTGYADYWGAYALDFLSEERLAIAPYNGLNRIPSYKALADASEVYTVILPSDWTALRSSDLTSLSALLSLENTISGEGPARRETREMIGESALIERRGIGPWDVWLLRRATSGP